MTATISFRLIGETQHLIVVPAFVNDTGPYDFVLDTGAGMTLLSPVLAEQLGVEIEGYKDALGAGGQIKVALGSVESLAIGDAKQPQMPIAVTEEIDKIATLLNTKIDGVIGHDLLKHYVMALNYPDNLLMLTATSSAEYQSKYFNPDAIDFRLASPAKPLILVPVNANHHGPFQFIIDTGASATVISKALAEQIGIEHTGMPEITGAGGKIAATMGTLTSLSVGKKELQGIEIVVADFFTTISEAVGTQMDGIVGYNFLKDFLITIDYASERLSLEN